MTEPRACSLCGDLAQPSVHFAAGYWGLIEEAARARFLEAQAEMADARRHRRMLASRVPEEQAVVARTREA